MFITITHDQDADFSTYSAEEQRRGLVGLEMLVTPDHDHYGRPLASLSNIAFFANDDDWTTGEFRSVEEIPATCTHLREVARQLLDEAKDVCPHCGSRNTASIGDEQECHDCGKTSEEEAESAPTPAPASAFLLSVQGEDSPIGVYSSRDKAVAEGEKLKQALGITYQAVEYIIDHTY